jgi:hypothetical protein
MLLDAERDASKRSDIFLNARRVVAKKNPYSTIV